MIRRFQRDDRGVTLTELAVASFVAAIVTAAAVVWAVQIGNADERHRQALEIVDELRWAKTELVSELRFAEDIFPPSSGDDEISMYIELNGIDGLQPGIGERVTYEILSNGDLQRSTDDATANAALMARDLIPSASSMVIVGTNTVEIEFVVDTDSGDSVEERTIKTTVKVRKINS
jgi:prepilin-type N-terminal cleavage/methylation domain-containing protein